MNRRNFFYNIPAIFFLLIPFLLHTAHSQLSAQPFELMAVSDLVRIFEDGYNLPPGKDTLKLFGIRGEVISGQGIIRTRKNLTNVTLKTGELNDFSKGIPLPSGIVQLNFVGSVPIMKNTPNQPDRVLIRKTPARFPDFLMPEMEIDVPGKTIKAFWISISIPEECLAGDYESLIRVKCDQGERSLPLQLKVYPFNLPKERHLKVTEWYTTDHFKKFHDIDEKYSEKWFNMLRRYADNMVQHRQNVFQVPMSSIGISQSGDGTFLFDFTRFDQIAQVFWDTGKMDFLETGELARFGDKGWSDTEIHLRSFELTDLKSGQKITLPGDGVIPHLLPAFENHLKEKGWLSKALFHIKDEPSLHNAIAWAEMSRYMHRYAPDLRRIDAIETSYILDEDILEIAVPKLDAFRSWHPSFEEWADRGNELWFYTVGIYQGSLLPNKTIDVPLIDARLLHWLNYRFDATGYLHWGWNQWYTSDPFIEIGEHVGDGWHVYPSKDGVINSLRWEQMRNGIQDYEYFVMLEDKIGHLKDSLGASFDWIDPKQRGKEIAAQVVPDLKEHTHDPDLLYKAKREVLKELFLLEASPKTYVQTDPWVNSEITNHSSVAVYGWAEPGSRVDINGTEIPVDERGLFLEQFGGDFIDPTKIPLGYQIRIRVVKGIDSKEIIRPFRVEY